MGTGDGARASKVPFCIIILLVAVAKKGKGKKGVFVGEEEGAV